MGGLPTTTFCRISLLVAAGKTTMPFELPMAVFASTTLLLPDVIPIPKLAGAPVEYPFPLVSFHRSELLLPWIHMPPHAAAAVPLRTETLLSPLICDVARPILMPEH